MFLRKIMKPFVLQVKKRGGSLQMVTCTPANPYMTMQFNKEKVSGRQ